MRRALILLALASSTAYANGRAPITNGVFFREGDASEIWVRTTFGLLVSRDDGCTFRWICEQNVGYGGIFDPRYLVARDDTIYATTFTGLRVSRDGGCTFSTATAELPVGMPGRIADQWVDALDLGPDDEVWVGTADAAAMNAIYRSTNAGMTFEVKGVTPPNIMWKSIRVAPSDALRVYATGNEIATVPVAHLYRSVDGGEQWQELPQTNLVFGTTPSMRLFAVDRTDEDLVFMTTLESNGMGDRLYRSEDGGMTMVEVLATAAPIVDLVMDGTTVRVATSQGGFVSSNRGQTFDALPSSLQFGCLGQRSDGKIFACGANWMPDYQAIGQSPDGQAWEKTFRFVELEGPVQCATGTPQADICEPMWPGLKEQFAAKGSTCGKPPDLTPDATGASSGGCCDTGGSTGGILMGAGVLLMLRRRRTVKHAA